MAPPSEKIDILIVDDREGGLIALEAVLSRPEYNLVRAQSGHEAIATLSEHDFAVILLDVQMPGIDGFETARIIKDHERYRDIPIIFVTAINKEERYVYKGYDHGAVDYVFKPFDSQILRSKVAVFADLHTKKRMLERQNETIRETERRERQLRLAAFEVESLKRYRNLADSIPHAVWRAKADGTMDYFNRVWATYTGLTKEQSIGGGWQSAFEPESLTLFLRTWMEAMNTSSPFETEALLKSQSGESRWHWIRVVPELGLANEVIAWLGTCTDIHKRKKIETELMRAREEADAANRAKTNFLANMSHEIRTPLNSILGFTELMSRPDSQADSSQYLETIKRNGTLLLKIIDEILDISKVEADRLEIERREFDLQAMLSEIKSFLEIQASEKGLKIHFDCLSTVPRFITSDPTRLRQILINIIGNAIKFTKVGRIDISIGWTSTQKENGLLQVRVRDTGIGVDRKHESRLFEPFMQADSTMTRRFGGTGLGLALSRRLARALDGDLWLDRSENQLERGATFALEIPAEPRQGGESFSSLTTTEHVATPPPIAAPAAGSTHPSVLNGVDVLVVDDASDNRTLISKFLSAAGATVDCASDGNEGVTCALKKQYDVVLMDIQMPGLDGYSATSRLRKQGYARPIIALTAHAMKEEREKSLSVGCDDHLTKPIDRTTLVHQVAKIVGKTLH